MNGVLLFSFSMSNRAFVFFTSFACALLALFARMSMRERELKWCMVIIRWRGNSNRCCWFGLGNWFRHWRKHSVNTLFALQFNGFSAELSEGVSLSHKLCINRMPAFYTGIFGHKPSRYMAPIAGLYPGGPKKIRFVTTGPLCRYMDDILPMLKVMVGPENTKTLQLDTPIDLNSFKLKVYR